MLSTKGRNSLNLLKRILEANAEERWQRFGSNWNETALLLLSYIEEDATNEEVKLK